MHDETGRAYTIDGDGIAGGGSQCPAEAGQTGSSLDKGRGQKLKLSKIEQPYATAHFNPKDLATWFKNHRLENEPQF